MLLLIQMLTELLNRTGMTFRELSDVLALLRRLGCPPVLTDKESFRVWLRALCQTFHGILNGTETGKDKLLMAFLLSLGDTQPDVVHEVFVLLSKPGAAPDDAAVQALVQRLRGADGPDAARVGTLMFTLVRLTELLMI